MAITRDFLNAIMKSVPRGMRPRGFLGALVVALIAAINPKSYFSRPYIGAVTWLILAWWFWNENPYGMIRPTKSDRETLIRGNPYWYQVFKTFGWALVFNFVPLFFIYLVMLVIARLDAKMSTSFI